MAPALALVLAGCAAGAPTASAPAVAGVHPGFDTWVYPGDELLTAWREASPYRWIGYYLTSPCHREESWQGRRAALERMGWGTAVLYVGQQAFEDDPIENPGADSILCSRTLLTPEQGRTDARDAIARARAEGFPAGTVVFLDVERMEAVPPEMHAYVGAWVAEITADGSYRPGIYAHRRNAPDLRAAALEAVDGSSAGLAFWIAGGGTFSLRTPPSGAGLPYATIWQGSFDVERSWGGRSLRIDENVATRASPSAPG